MEYRKFENTYVVRLNRGEEILACLKELVTKEDIRLASIDGLGAADHAVVGLYVVENREYHKKTFDGHMEITSLHGNVSRKDGEPYLHLHINLCDAECRTIGGHLNECRIAATCEMFVRTIEGEVGRRFDDEVTGLNLYQFN